MTKVLKADASAADAYVGFAAASVPESWLSFGLGLTSAALSFLTTLGNNAGLAQVADAISGPTNYALLYIQDPGAGDYWAGFTPTGSPSGSVPPPIAGWQDCEIHVVAGGPLYEFYIGGSLVFTTALAPAANLGAIVLGLFGVATPGPDAISYFRDVKWGTTRGASDLFADDFSSGNLSAWTSTSGDVSVVDDPFTPVPSPSRRPSGKLWRFVVCDLDGTALSWLDNLAEKRQVVYTLNAPAVATGQVPSDNPQVNLTVGSGSLAGNPIVSYSDRVLFGFRREGGAPSSINPGPWKIRFAGILMQLEDAAGADDATSQYTAYDPWQYMFSRPCRAGDGSLPGPEGLTFDSGLTTADQIIVNLIANTDVADGHTYIDALDGHIETIPFVGKINIQQGTSVGDAITQICNTGLLDVWMEPIYDPTVLPLFLAKLNIYAQQGSQRNDSPMSWDSPPKSLVGISRLLDGAQMANKIQFYNGQGGPPVALQTDGGSALEYGEYWAQQFFPAQVAAEAVEDIAAMQLELRKLGRRTLTINPAPERAPDPFTGYFLGDLVPVYATKRLRQALS